MIHSNALLTAPQSADSREYFEITHPFHPLRGKRFELISCKYDTVPGRVFYYDDDGCLRPIPIAWTSLAKPDPFCVVSDGRALFRVEDLLELARLIRRIRP